MTPRFIKFKCICLHACFFIQLLLGIFVIELTVKEFFSPLSLMFSHASARAAEALIIVLLYAVPLWFLTIRPLLGVNLLYGSKSRRDFAILLLKLLSIILLVEFLVMFFLPQFPPGADAETRDIADAAVTAFLCALPLWWIIRPEIRNRETVLAEALGTPLKLYAYLLAMVFLFDLGESLVVPITFPHGKPGYHKIFDAFMSTLFTASFLWIFMVRPLKRSAFVEKTRLDAVRAQVIDAIVTTDEQGLIESLNPAAEKIFGFNSGELTGKPAAMLLCHDHERLGRMIRGAAANKSEEATHILHEVTGCRKDGSVLIMDISVSEVLLNERRTFLMIMRDISDRKQMEDVLRESVKRFRQIFEQTEDAVIFFKPGTCSIIDVNIATEQLFGYTKSELQEGGLELITRGKDHERLSKCISGIRRGETCRQDVVAGVTKNGTEILVSMRGRVITLQDVDIIYCSFRDVTEKMRVEEESRMIQAKLIQANKMTSLGLLVSGVAHEINNPNNFIMANAQLLSRAWDDALKVLREYYRENGDFLIGGLSFREMEIHSPRLFSGIIDGSRRISEIIDSLKNFARQDRIPANGEVDVNRVITTSLSILHHELVKFTENFHIDLGENLPPVRGSSQQLAQVVINLLTNACHALPSRERGIWVSTGFETADGHVKITVRDEGSGMPPDVAGRIMEPFFTTKLDSGGTGLGLSISNSIIKDHNGFLEFESAPEAGTTFTVRIPAAMTDSKELN